MGERALSRLWDIDKCCDRCWYLCKVILSTSKEFDLQKVMSSDAEKHEAPTTPGVVEFQTRDPKA